MPKFKIVLLLIVCMFLLFPEIASAEESCLGFKLPKNSEKVSENRYLLSKSWEQARKFYRKAYRGRKGVHKIDAISIPGVLAIHYKNTRKKQSWTGANVSRIKGRVYVFCFSDGDNKPKKSKETNK